VKIYRDRFDIRHVESGRTVAKQTLTPFSTPRLLVGQFTEAEEALRDGIGQVLRGRWSLLPPRVVMQPMAFTEGGLCEVEERVLHELAIANGARDVSIWVGNELSDRDVLEKFKRP